MVFCNKKKILFSDESKKIDSNKDDQFVCCFIVSTKMRNGLVLATLVKDPTKLEENQHTLDLTDLDPATVLNDIGMSVLLRDDDVFVTKNLTHYTLIPTSDTKFDQPAATEDLSIFTFIEATGMYCNAGIGVTSPVVLLIRSRGGKDGLAITRSHSRYVLCGEEKTKAALIADFPFLEHNVLSMLKKK